MALSRLHITPFEFYRLSPAEFYAAIQDHQIREQSKLETQIHSIYEAVRLHGMWTYNFTPGVKRPIRDPQKLCKFPWEEKSQVSQQSPDQMKRVVKAIHALMKNNKKFSTKPKQPSNETKQ